MPFTLLSIIIVWMALDRLVYGSRWTRALVYSRMDPHVWSPPRGGETTAEAERRTIRNGVILSIGAAVLFTLLGEWLGFASFSLLSGAMTAFLLWATCIVPILLFERTYLAAGTRFLILQLFAWGAKIAVGMLLFVIR